MPTTVARRSGGSLARTGRESQLHAPPPAVPGPPAGVSGDSASVSAISLGFLGY